MLEPGSLGNSTVNYHPMQQTARRDGSCSAQVNPSRFTSRELAAMPSTAGIIFSQLWDSSVGDPSHSIITRDQSLSRSTPRCILVCSRMPYAGRSVVTLLVRDCGMCWLETACVLCCPAVELT